MDNSCLLLSVYDVFNLMNIAMPELHPVPVVSPWYHLGIDFVGPFHTPSIQGSHYILKIADYFSKFVQAISCKTKEACYISVAVFKVCGQLNMCIDKDYVMRFIFSYTIGINAHVKNKFQYLTSKLCNYV